MRRSTAIILAAGLGSRLQSSDYKIPKPLVKIHKHSILEHVLVKFFKAGITRIILVTGHERTRVGMHARRVAKQLGLDLVLSHNSRYRQGNGTSLLQGFRTARTAVIVSMVDHLHPVENYVALSKSKMGSYAVVDYSMPPYINLEDATKVRIRNNRITRFGKQLKYYDAIDSGLFFFSKAAQEVLLSLGRRLLPPFTISELLNYAIQNRFSILPISLPLNRWIDIDDPVDLQIARRLIKPLIYPSPYLPKEETTL